MCVGAAAAASIGFARLACAAQLGATAAPRLIFFISEQFWTVSGPSWWQSSQLFETRMEREVHRSSSPPRISGTMRLSGTFSAGAFFLHRAWRRGLARRPMTGSAAGLRRRAALSRLKLVRGVSLIC